MPVLCSVWQPVPQQIVVAHSQPSVSGAVAALQSARPELHAYVHVLVPASVVTHDGVPVVVLHAVQPPQADVALVCVSHPPVFGAVVLQSA
jgi:hypothetical protein